jgi:uncharacterized protein GlcG (DUF336 family)
MKMTLEEARQILKRAVEKSYEVEWISAYAITDAGGNLVSISRCDGAPAAAVALARSKAYFAALTGKTSQPFEHDVEKHPVRFHGWQDVLPKPLFGGPGAVPIKREGKVIGGFSSSVSYAASGMQKVIDGQKYSREELVTSYALQIPYEDQHADTP